MRCGTKVISPSSDTMTTTVGQGAVEVMVVVEADENGHQRPWVRSPSGLPLPGEYGDPVTRTPLRGPRARLRYPTGGLLPRRPPAATTGRQHPEDVAGLELDRALVGEALGSGLVPAREPPTEDEGGDLAERARRVEQKGHDGKDNKQRLRQPSVQPPAGSLLRTARRRSAVATTNEVAVLIAVAPCNGDRDGGASETERVTARAADRSARAVARELPYPRPPWDGPPPRSGSFWRSRRW